MDTNKSTEGLAGLPAEQLLLNRQDLNILIYALGALHATAFSKKGGAVNDAIIVASLPVARKLGINIEYP